LPKRRPDLANAATQADAPSMRAKGDEVRSSPSHVADVQDFDGA
jgi:hypothetical protein